MPRIMGLNVLLASPARLEAFAGSGPALVPYIITFILALGPVALWSVSVMLSTQTANQYRPGARERLPPISAGVWEPIAVTRDVAVAAAWASRTPGAPLTPKPS